MMDVPLLVPAILRHAAAYHGDTEIVSRDAAGALHRTTYAATATRVAQLAHALTQLGLRAGDRVGTLAWNGFRHLDLYYATAGAGLVCHTINPRLFPAQVAGIIRHADDRVLCVDPMLLPLLDRLAPALDGLRAVIVLGSRADMADIDASHLCYDEMLAGQPEQFDWPALDERAACGLCYTSGTTGEPKGVLYSHRSTVLHAMSICLPDVFALSARDVVMPAVPMFHVNAWGMPYAAPMVGAKLVLPGPRLDGASLHRLITAEGVTCSAGVPTIWMGLLDHVERAGLSLAPLQRVVIGGAACPPAMIDRFAALGVQAIHAWGMTETSPLGVANHPKAQHLALPPEQRRALACKQGRPPFGVELRLVDADGRDLPHDGVAFGDLLVRGPWIAAGYLGDATGSGSDWFHTGDVATIDADGALQIVDRSKDVIKSGGEWISSIALENIALLHPAIHEAAVIAMPHPRWSERPLLVVACRPGMSFTPDDMAAHYAGRVATWWVPDELRVVAELPHTATGKLLKTRLRELFCTPTT